VPGQAEHETVRNHWIENDTDAIELDGIVRSADGSDRGHHSSPRV